MNWRNFFAEYCHNIDMIWEAIQNWFLSLGTEYGVNPFIFGAIYIGAIPFFSLSIGRLIQNYRKGRSIVLPALSAMFFFVSAYIYLIFAGKNVPWWVYGVVVLLIALGGYSTYKKVRRQIGEVSNKPQVSKEIN
ncbi:MAG TPA: hypothetical protein PKE69_18255 [Pyrinomonadaceae bacterium]|nr:hypothetical protein [Pyrinomonadaceae bacterium]